MATIESHADTLTIAAAGACTFCTMHASIKAIKHYPRDHTVQVCKVYFNNMLYYLQLPTWEQRS